MLRALMIGLTLLHLGPGLAFAMLAFGCEGVQPLLGVFCEAAGFAPFLQLTLFWWLLLGFAALAMPCIQRARRLTVGSAAALRWRSAALLLLIAAGLTVGVGGRWLFDTDWGFVALPLLLIAGWLALANPAECVAPEPESQRGQGDRP